MFIKTKNGYVSVASKNRIVVTKEITKAKKFNRFNAKNVLIQLELKGLNPELIKI